MRIVDARKRAGVTQAELARRLGLNQSTVSRLEQGRSPLTVDRLFDVSRVLGIPVSELLDGRGAA